MSRTITVGRQGDQPFQITDTTVSRKHCSLTIDDSGNMFVENLSPGGTYINGLEIIKKKVAPDTVLRLGQSYSIRVSDIISNRNNRDVAQHTSGIQTAGNQTKSFPYAAKFKSLDNVYRNYSEKKLVIRKENSVGVAESAVPFVLGAIPGVGGIIRSGIMARNATKRAAGANRIAEITAQLTEIFKIDYVCPKCGNFLGDTPYAALVNRNRCNSCKCVWLSESDQKAEQDRLSKLYEETTI